MTADGGVLLALGASRNRTFHSPSVSDEGVTYTSPAGDFSVLTRLTDGTWRRRLKDGMEQVFDSDGRLVTSADRNGNTRGRGVRPAWAIDFARYAVRVTPSRWP